MTIVPGVALRIDCASAVAGSILNIRGSVLATGGRIVPISWVTPSPAVATWTSWLLQLPCGELISIAADTVATAWRIGDSVCTLRLWYGTLATGTEIARLCRGWPSFPGTCQWARGQASTLDVRQLGSRIIQVANPALAANFTLDIGLWTITTLLGVTWALVTSAAAGTRNIALWLTPEASGAWNFQAVATQAPSLTRVYQFAPLGSLEYTVGSYIYTPIPPVSLRMGSTIRSSCAVLQAGDQISEIRVWGIMHYGEQLDW